MKKAIKIILYLFIGTVVSVILALISQGIHTLLTCAIVGFIIAALIYYNLKSEMNKLIAVVAFIISAFGYLYLYMLADSEWDSLFLGWIVFCVPYTLLSAILIEGSSKE
jgi:uncharacterized membrane protein